MPTDPANKRSPQRVQAMLRTTGRWLSIVIVGGSVLWLALSRTSPSSQSYPDDRALLRAEPSEWLSYGRDLGGTHYSPLAQLNTDNVGELGLAWYYDTNSYPGQLEGTPLVANGTLYSTLTWSVVFAVDARTGEEKWRWDPQIPQQTFVTDARGIRHRRGPSLCCGPVNRGLALYKDRVYVGLLDGSLVSLNAETGKVIWRVQTTAPGDDYTITGAPRVINGMVIVGNSGAEFGLRGFISAYDAETGEMIWRFYTVPGDPSLPFESEALERAAETWSGAWWRFGGGGTVWDGMAYDPELDLFYFGVGNGGPWPRDIRSPGGGDNLYISSIVAIRPKTGEYVWHYQTTPGDDWDYAATQPLVLADLVIDGRLRKVVMQAPKNGFFYVIDRETGEFISGKPFAHVTWASGIDPETGRPIETSIGRYGPEGAMISPATDGAHNWHSMAWHPGLKLAFIPGQETEGFFALDTDFALQPGRMNTGLRRRAFQPATTAPRPPASPRIDPNVVGLGGQQKEGFLVAWDPIAQEERWRIQFEEPGVTGGTLATAGGLLFHGDGKGIFRAYRASDGKSLWEVQLAPGFANPITYELDGQQYVSVVTGRGGTLAPGRVYTFALGAQTEVPSMAMRKPPPPPPIEPPPGGFAENENANDAVLQDLGLPGRQLVLQNCVSCHPATALARNRMPREGWQMMVTAMVNRWLAGSVTAGESDAIVDYLARAFGEGT